MKCEGCRENNRSTLVFYPNVVRGKSAQDTAEEFYPPSLSGPGRLKFKNSYGEEIHVPQYLRCGNAYYDWDLLKEWNISMAISQVSFSALGES